MTKAIDWTPEGFAEALERSMQKLAKQIVAVDCREQGRLRIWVGDDCHCPITLVCLAETGRSYRATDYLDAAEDLGYQLGAGLAMAIAGAADDGGSASPHRAAMRRVLASWEVA